MNNSFGNALNLSIFGESHGEAIGFLLDGLPAGILIDTEYIEELLSLRLGESEISTKRREKDDFKILSGVKDGKTCGTPILFVIKNGDVVSENYEKTRFLPRPSHADYPLFVRNCGFEDSRGGGHSSGRLTAPLVAAGGLILPLLKAKGISVATHISSIYNVKDAEISEDTDLSLLFSAFPVICQKSGEKMREEIKKAQLEKDSVGGTLETVIMGLPVGVGEPFFDSVESVISHAAFSVPGVKGIEFGKGFMFSDLKGSSANDEYILKDGKIALKTNNNGGITGGFTNGADVVFKTVLKPTPTISLPQNTVNLETMSECEVKFDGRHDPSFVPRAAIVQTCVTAFAVCDLLTKRYGSDWLKV